MIFPILKVLNSFVPKSIMGNVDSFKVPSPASMMCSSFIRFITNAVNIYLPKIIPYLHLSDSST